MPILIKGTVHLLFSPVSLDSPVSDVINDRLNLKAPLRACPRERRGGQSVQQRINSRI